MIFLQSYNAISLDIPASPVSANNISSREKGGEKGMKEQTTFFDANCLFLARVENKSELRVDERDIRIPLTFSKSV